MDIFGVHSTYWLKKTSLPRSLQLALSPYAHRGLKLLDVGCGGGRIAIACLPYFSKIHAIDRSAKLVQEAEKQFPDISFHLGNFEDPTLWPKVDVVISNCAIRKDCCSLRSVAQLCIRNSQIVILRIQGIQDLNAILPEQQRQHLFYNKQEIQQTFGEVDITEECYPQRFSSVAYIEQFLQRIGIKHQGRISYLTLWRHYYIVKWKGGES